MSDSTISKIRDAIRAEKDWRRNRIYDEAYEWRDATMELMELIDAIDHVHVPTTHHNWGVETQNCLFDTEPWPCWHHRQIHPDDPVVQDYVEKVRQQMDEIS